MLLVAPIAALLVAGWTHRWITDDGFIYLRIVEQVEAGNGPVFNAGERVEAYTSPLWLAMLVVVDALVPVRLEWISVLLGLGAAAAGVAMAMAGASRLSAAEGVDRMVVPVGAAVVLAPFASWIWLTSGLETGLTWAWLGACLLLLARWADGDGPPGAPSCVVLGLGWLVRPELVVLSALFLLVLVIGDRERPPRALLRTVAIGVAVPVAYQVLRMGYFGMVTSNTAVAKEGSTVVWDRGVAYLEDFVGTYRLWIPLAVLAVGAYVPLVLGASTRRRLVVGAFALGATTTATYVVAVGGDYLHGRMFIPSLFAACAPVAMVPLERRFAASVLVAPWVVLAAVSMRPPAGLLAETFAPTRFGRVTIDDYGWGEGGSQVAWFGDAPLYLEQNPFRPADAVPAPFELTAGHPRPAVSASSIGIVGYALGPDVHIVDLLGLADPIGSHLEPRPERDGQVGHEKPLPASWLVAQVAEPGASVGSEGLGFATTNLYPLLAVPPAADFDEQVAAVRRLLRCPVMERLDDAATGHLGPRRFLRNLVQAPSNTRVRFPADPEEAEAVVCPGGPPRS